MRAISDAFRVGIFGVVGESLGPSSPRISKDLRFAPKILGTALAFVPIERNSYEFTLAKASCALETFRGWRPIERIAQIMALVPLAASVQGNMDLWVKLLPHFVQMFSFVPAGRHFFDWKRDEAASMTPLETIKRAMDDFSIDAKTSIDDLAVLEVVRSAAPLDEPPKAL